VTQTYRHNDVQNVLDATDLVRLIGERVNLRPAGREFKGLCPFHDDTNPSMCVVPHKGFFHCFVCGTGGDALRFVQLHQHIEFGEALRYLADRAGIQLTPRRPQNGNEDSQADEAAEGYSTAQIVEAHRQALSFYRTLLRSERHGSVGRRLFADRGIDEAMVERFELGIAPTDPTVWDGLVRTLSAKDAPLGVYEAVGLLIPRRDGSGFVDRFRNRLIFPIHDEHARPIAFGARKIDPDDEPKYLNSPEHPRFKKSRTLYGLHLARLAIQKSKTAVIVEGYTDVIACHQHDVANAVATLGTALTDDHARLLARWCERVVLVFDGDVAGQKAADRAVEVFFESRIAVLPGGVDPAELLAQSGGVETWHRVIGESVDALAFLFASLRARLTDDSTGVTARQRVIEAFLTRLGSLGFHRMTPLRRDLMLARLSDILHLPGDTLLRSIPRPRPRQELEQRDESAEGELMPAVAPRRIEAEMRLIACLLHCPSLLETKLPGVAALDPDQFAWPAARRLFEAVSEADAGPVRRSMGVPAGLPASLANEAAAWMMRVHREVREDPEAIREHFAAYRCALDAMQQTAAYETQAASVSAAGGSGSDVRHAMSKIDQLRALGGNAGRFARTAKSLAPAAKGYAGPVHE